MSEQLKHVSKKKIIFVQIDEELTGVFQKIEKLPYKEIYLVIPKRAVLLQSIVNLKILKQKMEEIEKTLAIITNDPNGMKLALQAEIKVFDQWDMANPSTALKEEKDPDSALVKPIPATQNDVEDDSPTRLPKRKSSIFEVVRELKNRDKGFSLRSYLADFRKNRLQHQPLQLTPGKKKWIAAFLTASLVTFFVVVYVVLPGATVSIQPTADVVTKGVNVNLSSNPSEDHDLQAYPLEVSVETTVSHASTGFVNNGTNAAGTLTILNLTNQERPLIASTRFQTEDGLVFRIQKEVVVPAGSPENPGKLEAAVVADALDAGGAAIGDRGNIGPSSFFLPGLKEDSRAELYAESYTAMTGGSSDVVVHVTEEDILAAEKELEAALKEKILAELRKKALSSGNLQGLNLKVLEDDSTLVFGLVKSSPPYDLIGQEKNQFEVTGSITLSGVAYDSDALYDLLKTEILSVETPGKQLVSVDKDSISLQVLESNTSAQKYKVTAQIQGVEEYRIEPELEGGGDLAKKIIDHIAGKSIDEATAYIENLPEVNKVEISVWPVWSPKIPTLSENIKIKSLSQGVRIE